MFELSAGVRSGDDIAGSAASLVRTFSSQPLETACSCAVNYLRTALSRLARLSGDSGSDPLSVAKSIFLHKRSLGLLSPERFWVLHLAGLLPFDQYLAAVDAAALATFLTTPEEEGMADGGDEAEGPSLQRCLWTDVVHFIFDSAFVSPLHDALVQAKNRIILDYICFPSRLRNDDCTARSSVSQAEPPAELNDLRCLCRALCAIRTKSGSANYVAAKEFQVKQLMLWFPCALVEGDGAWADALATLEGHLSPGSLLRAVERSLTVDQCPSVLDYAVYGSMRKSFMSNFFFLLVGRGTSDRELRDLAFRSAIIAVDEKLSKLFLRCLCLHEILVFHVDTRLFNQNMYVWLNQVIDATGSVEKMDEAAGAGCTDRLLIAQLASVQFLCRALVESIYFHSQGALRGIVRCLRERRGINRESVDEYMVAARHRLESIERCDVFISGYAYLSTTEKSGSDGKAGPELNGDRIAAWAKTFAETRELPPAVIQFCSFCSAGHEKILAKMSYLIKHGECATSDCDIILRAMTQGDHPLCSDDEAIRFRLICMRNSRVDRALRSVFGSLSDCGEMVLIMRDIFDIGYAMCDCAADGRTTATSAESDELEGRWRETCDHALAAMKRRQMTVDSWCPQKVYAAVVLLSCDLCCAVAAGGERGGDEETMSSFFRTWMKTLRSICGQVSCGPTSTAFETALLAVFDLPFTTSTSGTDGLALLLLSLEHKVMMNMVDSLVFYNTRHDEKVTTSTIVCKLLLVQAIARAMWRESSSASCPNLKKPRIDLTQEKDAGPHYSETLQFDTPMHGKNVRSHPYFSVVAVAFVLLYQQALRYGYEPDRLLLKSSRSIADNLILRGRFVLADMTLRSPYSECVACSVSSGVISEFLNVRDSAFMRILAWGLRAVDASKDHSRCLRLDGRDVVATMKMAWYFLWPVETVVNILQSLQGGDACDIVHIFGYISERISRCVSDTSAIPMTEEVVTSFISIVSEIFLSFVPTGFLWIALPTWMDLISQKIFEADHNCRTSSDLSAVLQFSEALVTASITQWKCSTHLLPENSEEAGRFVPVFRWAAVLLHSRIGVCSELVSFASLCYKHALDTPSHSDSLILFAASVAFIILESTTVALEAYSTIQADWTINTCKSMVIDISSEWVQKGCDNYSIDSIVSDIQNAVEHLSGGGEGQRTLSLQILTGDSPLGNARCSQMQSVCVIVGRLRIFGILIFRSSGVADTKRFSVIDLLREIINRIRYTFPMCCVFRYTPFYAGDGPLADLLCLELCCSFLVAHVLCFSFPTYTFQPNNNFPLLHAHSILREVLPLLKESLSRLSLAGNTGSIVFGILSSQLRGAVPDRWEKHCLDYLRPFLHEYVDTEDIPCSDLLF